MTYVLWSAELTQDMVKNLEQEQVLSLIEDLCDAVMAVCLDYGVE